MVIHDMNNIKCRVSAGNRGVIDGRIVHFITVPYSLPDGSGDLPPFKVFALVVADDDGKITTEDIDNITVRQGALT